MDKIGIVLLNWNGWRDTVRCIQSLRSLDYPDYMVVVVDNASTDDSVSELAAFDDIHLIRSDKNLGFAGGCNIGILYCLEQSFDYVMLLNNDAVIETLTLTSMVSVIKGYKKALVSPIIYNQDGTIQCAGTKLNRLLGRVKPYIQYHKDHVIDYLTGCCLLFPVCLIHDVGYLDEGFFMYWEDVDFSLRAVNEGYRLILDPKGEVVHKNSASTADIPYQKELYFNRSQLLFMKKHHRYKSMLVNVLIRFVKGLVLGKWHSIKAIANVWFFNQRL